MPKRNLEKELLRSYKIGLGHKAALDNFMSSPYGKELKRNEFVVVRSGYPSRKWTHEDGEMLIITPETDLRNELVIQHIEAWQKDMIKKHDKPPHPQKIKGSREKNWMPVWEWNMRHPNITRKELAAMLNISSQYLKTKLENLDKQADNPFLIAFQK